MFSTFGGYLQSQMMLIGKEFEQISYATYCILFITDTKHSFSLVFCAGVFFILLLVCLQCPDYKAKLYYSVVFSFRVLAFSLV